jgi:hypothetical protein
LTFRIRISLKPPKCGDCVSKSFIPLLVCAVAGLTPFGTCAVPPGPQVRLNQVGYLIADNKEALLMAGSPITNASFQVVGTNGSVEFSGPVGKSTGSWNQEFRSVYRLDFSELKRPGVYFIKVDGVNCPVSQSFTIGTGQELYGPLIRNSLTFFKAQRDGPDVSPAVMNRKPSHLADQQAFIYRVPTFGKNGMLGGLEKIGGPINVSGGWFDAGDYLKFVETASYVTSMMLVSARDYPARAGKGTAADFTTEGRYGLDWLLKMWNDETKTLYAQVGIGDGNQQVTGDHDVWRLPEADDKLKVEPGDPKYFIKFRAVLPAKSIDGRISPNLAGRLAAAFALGCQVFKTSDPPYAQKLLRVAEHIFELAATTNVTALTTVYPGHFYPEEEWRDDLELGAVELASAFSERHAGPSEAKTRRYLEQAAYWARTCLDSGGGDSLNLYDVSSLGHYELCRALEQAGDPKDLKVQRAELLAALKKRLDSAVKRSGKEPFGLGTRYGSDLVPHILGLVLEVGFYDDLTHTTTYADFAQRQLDFVLGRNPWGTSFIVGAGMVFPFHMQHQVANLAGSLDGSLPILLGATVDGPARGKPSRAGDVPEGARATPWPGGNDPFAAFNGNGVYYMDDVGSWATVEPADDYTVPTVLIFARLSSLAP